MRLKRDLFARLCAAIMLLAGLCGHSTRAFAVSANSTGSPRIMISEDRALVRESFEVMVVEPLIKISIPNFPDFADPSTVQALDPGRILSLLSWTMPSQKPASRMSVDAAGRSILVNFDADQPSSPDESLVLEMQAVMTGLRRFDLVYVMTGLQWKTTYDVLLRGDLRKINSPMSVDVEGWVVIHNASNRRFSNAVVSIVGADYEGEALPVKEPGFLDLDEDSPLADLWRFQPPLKRPANIYTLANPVTMLDRMDAMISLVSVARKPVSRILFFRPDDIPTSVRGRTGAYPSQIIQFQNTRDYGGGRSVPAGPALIHLGSMRTALFQEAWFKHTPAQGAIRIDMGKFPGITARRVDRGRVPRVGGGFEQRYEIIIDNHLEEEVSVWLPEHPPTTLAWSVLRSNTPYELVDRRLMFQPVVKPKSETIIQYTLSLTMPGL